MLEVVDLDAVEVRNVRAGTLAAFERLSEARNVLIDPGRQAIHLDEVTRGIVLRGCWERDAMCELEQERSRRAQAERRKLDAVRVQSVVRGHRARLRKITAERGRMAALADLLDACAHV